MVTCALIKVLCYKNNAGKGSSRQTSWSRIISPTVSHLKIWVSDSDAWWGGKLQIHEMNIKIDTVIVVLSDYGSEDITILGNGRAFISAVSI